MTREASGAISGEQPVPVPPEAFDVVALLAEVDHDRELEPCGLRRLVLGSGALEVVADTVAELLSEAAAAGGSALPDRPSVVLLVDAVPILRGTENAKDLVERQLADRFAVRRVVLDDGQRELHVVDDVLDAAAAEVQGADAVVAVGGGSISDIAKVAVARAGAEGPRPVLVSVQTAASVDGFTDDVSVVLRDGVKRTVPSSWPDAVVADAETIAGAPARMTRAGFGEMTSMWLGPADWRLASLVGTDHTFKPGSVRLLDLVGADISTWADGVRTGEPADVARLTRALALRGLATGVSGTTAVLSGMEHLVSHMLDQHHTEHHLPMGLHGAQVGVAGVVAASAWEMLVERLDASPAPPSLDEVALDRDAAEARVGAAFAGLDPTGRIGAECWREYSRKLSAVDSARTDLETFLASWPEHRAELLGLVRPSREVAARLRSAGAAVTFDELEPAVEPDLARWAVTNCALMRNRFTIVDLLTLLGWWDHDDVEEVLERTRRSARPDTAAVA